MKKLILFTLVVAASGASAQLLDTVTYDGQIYLVVLDLHKVFRQNIPGNPDAIGDGLVVAESVDARPDRTIIKGLSIPSSGSGFWGGNKMLPISIVTSQLQNTICQFVRPGSSVSATDASSFRIFFDKPVVTYDKARGFNLSSDQEYLAGIVCD